MATESQKIDFTNHQHEHHPTTENQAENYSTDAQSQSNIFTRAWRFSLHFIEMVLVMCIGGFALNYIFFTALARLGYTDMLSRYPAFSIFMIGILLAIVMVVWMRFRGHDWRTTLEMASTSVILAVVIIVLFWLNVMPQGYMLSWIKRLACPIMLIPMVFRLDVYTSSHASHSRHSSVKTAQEPSE